ncbi:MAG: pyridoxamine 5-phosphate oxidase [Pseudonocardiales bacterium]|nr:pyridoxamine 5-phosphate oxidase [Pseudonocardiales bacterium]
MARWTDVVSSAPEFAATVQRIFDANRHKTIATLRVDGAPRISGIEAEFKGGELTFGSMPGARKGADLRRDRRFALHSASVDPPEGDPSGWQGDAKISGRAVPTKSRHADMFRADIAEVVLTRVGTPADHLVIQLWRPGREITVTRR